MTIPILKNPSVNKMINPNINRAVNPNINRVIDPNINREINPNTNREINPNTNRMLNPKINENINPKINERINPKINENINPKINGMLNPMTNLENYQGLLIYDMTLTVVEFIVETGHNDVIQIFNENLENTRFGVKHTQNGYLLFDLNLNCIAHLESDSQTGYNEFGLNNDWQGIIK